MKAYLYLMVIIFSLNCYANEEWQIHWEQGQNYFSKSYYQEASSEFDQAINFMSDEDLRKYPYVLVDRAENNYYLEDYLKVMEDTGKALQSRNLTDHERLDCGLKRIAVLMQLGDQDAAIEEYKKYIIGCPLFPK